MSIQSFSDDPQYHHEIPEDGQGSARRAPALPPQQISSIPEDDDTPQQWG